MRLLKYKAGLIIYCKLPSWPAILILLIQLLKFYQIVSKYIYNNKATSCYLVQELFPSVFLNRYETKHIKTMKWSQIFFLDITIIFWSVVCNLFIEARWQTKPTSSWVLFTKFFHLLNSSSNIFRCILFQHGKQIKKHTHTNKQTKTKNNQTKQRKNTRMWISSICQTPVIIVLFSWTVKSVLLLLYFQRKAGGIVP